jgi:hypothetical protein
VGDASQATITFDTAALGTPYAPNPGAVDYNNAVISFSADSNVFTSVASNIRVFDNVQQGAWYYDGMQFDVSAGGTTLRINLMSRTTSPSQMTTSTNLPSTPFDISALAFRDYSYTLNNGVLASPTSVLVDLRSLAPSVPEPSTWAMMILGQMGACAVVVAHV